MSNKTKTPGWDFEKDELLIELVKQKPELYDMRAPRYNDVIAKRAAWQEIGDYLSKQGTKCKERWESLRGQHRKNLNKQRHRPGTLPKWRYEDQMAFLREFMKDKSQTSGEEDVQMDESDDDVPEEEAEIPEEHVKVEEDSITFTTSENSNPLQTFGKRKNTQPHIENPSKQPYLGHFPEYLRQKRCSELLPGTIDTFFSLMATTVKTFTPADQHFIKTQIFSLVSKIEEKYISENQNFPYLLAPPQNDWVSLAASSATGSRSSSPAYQNMHDDQSL